MMRTIQRKGNLIHRLFAILFLVSAVLTVLPNAAASKECRLGYKAVCSFTPFGTLILIGLSALHVFLAVKRTGSMKRREI